MTQITDWNKLTPKQQDHLTRIGEVTTDETVGALFNAQKELRIRYRVPGEPVFEPCWDCRAIAKILGYEV